MPGVREALRERGFPEEAPGLPPGDAADQRAADVAVFRLPGSVYA